MNKKEAITTDTRSTQEILDYTRMELFYYGLKKEVVDSKIDFIIDTIIKTPFSISDMVAIAGTYYPEITDDFKIHKKLSGWGVDVMTATRYIFMLKKKLNDFLSDVYNVEEHGLIETFKHLQKNEKPVLSDFVWRLAGPRQFTIIHKLITEENYDE